ncbi:hypothetical protein D3C76_1681780 [compost metagenome]
MKAYGAAFNITVEEGSSYAVKYQKTQDIIRKRIPEAILSTPEKFDAVYDAMLVELDKAGAVDMEKEYTELVKERVDLWSGK